MAAGNIVDSFVVFEQSTNLPVWHCPGPTPGQTGRPFWSIRSRSSMLAQPAWFETVFLANLENGRRWNFIPGKP